MLLACHECGGKVSSEAKACPRCGAPPKQKLECLECGAESSLKSTTCGECGAPLTPIRNGATQIDRRAEVVKSDANTTASIIPPTKTEPSQGKVKGSQNGSVKRPHRTSTNDAPHRQAPSDLAAARHSSEAVRKHKINCPHCSQRIAVTNKQLATVKTASCPNCGRQLTLSNPSRDNRYKPRDISSKRRPSKRRDRAHIKSRNKAKTFRWIIAACLMLSLFAVSQSYWSNKAQKAHGGGGFLAADPYAGIAKLPFIGGVVYGTLHSFSEFGEYSRRGKTGPAIRHLRNGSLNIVIFVGLVVSISFVVSGVCAMPQDGD